MSAERFQQIEALYHAAREKSAEERAALLGQADPELRREVESLLAQGTGGEFLERPALEHAPQHFEDATLTELAVGARIGPYRIEGKLGAGGMGVVYRARDTKLGRDVALKVLPESLACDAERVARFRREAKVLASLNHPNVAAIHGFEDSGGAHALVMELVEGPNLAQRIAKGAIPVDEAMAIARQICAGLEYAHEHGIVHRDLKPANVAITANGAVKLLDFGLAKALEGGPVTGDLTGPAAISRAVTRGGEVLGTAAYMSPEQAKGRAVDRRADIWAFGCVLYETLTGERAFAGESIADTLAVVLKSEPDLSRLPGATPRQVRDLLQRCLQKDPMQRLRDIGDARIALDEIAAPLATAREGADASSRLPVKLGALIAVIAALFGGAAVWLAKPRPTSPPRPLTRLNVDLGPEAMNGIDVTVAISPDGRRLVFPARGPDGTQELATQMLDQSSATLLAGTEGGSDPFFSPDGQWIGFFAGDKLKKISVQGGAPVTLPASFGSLAYNASWVPGGASWGEDGNIITNMGPGLPLWRVPAAGGTVQPFTKLEPGEVAQRWPQVLPGGDAVLFTANGSPTGFDNANIEAIWAKTGRISIVQRGGYYGRYLPGGYLVYVHRGTLFGVKFDLGRLEERGAPVPLLDDVAANPATGGGQFDFSNTGTFVYAAGKSSSQGWQIDWLDSSGKLRPLLATPGEYVHPRLSPDGRKLACVDGGDVVVYDLERGMATRLTFSGGADMAVWAPDGKHLAYDVSSGSGGSSFYWIRSDGSGKPQLLLQSANLAVPWSFSPDGRNLAYRGTSARTGFDLWVLPLDSTDADHPRPGKPQPFLRTPADELVPSFSPDGRWIAYRSDETGSMEIYVRPFPPTVGGQWQISSGGGLYALWSKDGRELFYETPDNRIMVADYAVNGAAFVPGKPKLWSSKQIFFMGTSNLDLGPDARRFAILTPPEAAGPGKSNVHVTMLLDFFDQIRREIR